MGTITFSALGKTGTLRFFIRNWKRADVYRHGIYASLNQYPADPQAAYRIILDAGFHYEAPDGLSARGSTIPNSDTPRTDARPIHNTPHITQVFNDFLQKEVFAFAMHFAVDGDMVGGYKDRQRLELKTMDTGSAFDAAGDSNNRMYSNGGGDSFTHRWKFCLPKDFAVSSEYTHLHQIKPEGGDSGNPTFTLTARRKSNGEAVMQLIYRGPIRANGDPSQNTYPCEVPLEGFLGEWVRAEETVIYDNPGAYQFKLVRLRDMRVLMHYIYFPQQYEEFDPFVMFRPGNSYIRPKFGLYRRIMHISPFGLPDENDPVKGLKDETILFADIEMDKLR